MAATLGTTERSLLRSGAELKAQDVLHQLDGTYRLNPRGAHDLEALEGLEAVSLFHTLKGQIHG